MPAGFFLCGLRSNFDCSIIEEGSSIRNKRPNKQSLDFSSVTKRFRVQIKEDQFKCNLPNKMAEYADTHLQVFIPNKGVDWPIFWWICSPPNIDKVIDNSGEEAKLSKVNSGNLWFFDTSDDKGRGV